MNQLYYNQIYISGNQETGGQNDMVNDLSILTLRSLINRQIQTQVLFLKEYLGTV